MLSSGGHWLHCVLHVRAVQHIYLQLRNDNGYETGGSRCNAKRLCDQRARFQIVVHTIADRLQPVVCPGEWDGGSQWILSLQSSNAAASCTRPMLSMHSCDRLRGQLRRTTMLEGPSSLSLPAVVPRRVPGTNSPAFDARLPLACRRPTSIHLYRRAHASSRQLSIDGRR